MAVTPEKFHNSGAVGAAAKEVTLARSLRCEGIRIAARKHA